MRSARQYIAQANLLSKKGDIVYLECNIPEELLEKIRPGQFFNISFPESLSVFVRRPISVCNISKGKAFFLIKQAGRATKMISNSHELSLMGPLGNAFTEPNERDILIAGGVGIAPLYFLKKSSSSDPKLLWGIREKKDAGNYPDDIVSFVDKIYSDDDTPLPANIEKILSELRPSKVYCCANQRLTRRIIDVALPMGIKVEASLEAHMGCGWGACNGCFTKIAGKSLYVCKDGPVVEFSG